jgi:multicopper oxidase
MILKNTAKAPYPKGDSPDGQTTGQVMLFRIVPLTTPDPSSVPALLATVNRLTNPTVTRTMTLNEMQDDGAPVSVLLNGSTYDGGIPVTPALGTTEMWEVVNMSGDTHPIHLHLVQFQLLNRQKFNTEKYEKAFTAANPVLPTTSYTPVSVTPYLKGKPVPADPNERGWKDTYRMNPGEVTRILIRFAPQDESPAYAFDATAEPGYVWHCHILEHEENDMMQAFHVVAATPAILAAKNAASTEATWTGDTQLRAPAPNPVQVKGDLKFTLGTAGRVEIALYSVTGRRVATIASGWFEAGEHTVPWRRTGNAGETLANGIYFVRLRGAGIDLSQKLVVAN